jgi:hypothetical protein
MLHVLGVVMRRRGEAMRAIVNTSGSLSVTYASPAPGTSAHAAFDVTGCFVGP